MRLVPVAVAMFVRRNPQGVFETWIQEREAGPLKGFWEFPGGKIESGETAWQAVVREIQEETNVSIKNQGQLLGIFHHDYGEKRVLLHLFKIPWEDSLINAPGLVVPLKNHDSAHHWGVNLLPANFRFVEHLYLSIYDGANEHSTA
ncbi:MAG: NUDIX domain-containing protein [Bacteriovoracaceae bacterium]|nr:NUDIX domain-containing protein [Bacteriovoracaceae bacterium]